jgi:tagaturonate epimerase
MRLGKYSFGIGDRFARQGEAQLEAFLMAKQKGMEITPVWNKSNREHLTIGSDPLETRLAAGKAVNGKNWDGPWFVDADHINMGNVDKFIGHADFFTIDVADYIGKKAPEKELEKFAEGNTRFTGNLEIPGISEPFRITRDDVYRTGGKFLYAIREAGRIYRHIESEKGSGRFITEISMDEVNEPQSPVELFFILSAIAAEKIPVSTIAPKFSGRFNKGVDYQGDIQGFAREFEQDLLVIDHAKKEFGLPEDLKLSVHSGSDKFSLYPVIGQLIRKHDRGIHIKTAGTTWLEEMTGLSLAGGPALEMAVDIYARALDRFDELCGPYSTVIDIDKNRLPTAGQVSGWDGEKFANTLRHDPGHPDYNPDMRQLVHVAYKVAAEYGNEFTGMLEKYEPVISRQVTSNIYERHFRRLFEL